jgi:hypothetical protein
MRIGGIEVSGTQTCIHCGEPIAFRYVDGRPTPIHLNGNFCGAGQVSPKAIRAFDQPAHYINPNAKCPVCGASVFFFQSSSGGRVFFDNLGWPWPKHPCTDNPASQSFEVLYERMTRSAPRLTNKKGEQLEIYELLEIQPRDSSISFLFQKIRGSKILRLAADSDFLASENIELSDFRDAPSFLFTRGSEEQEECIAEFVSTRHKTILRVPLKKV